MLGKQVTVNSSQLRCRQGSSSVNFNTTAAEPIAISVTNASGAQVASATMAGTAGSNTWMGNGRTSNGSTNPGQGNRVGDDAQVDGTTPRAVHVDRHCDLGDQQQR